MSTGRIGIAIIGCGYVADFYRQCLPLHSDELHLCGVYDRDPQRLRAFAACWGDPAYETLGAALEDAQVSIVVNLTDPESHFEVTQACIAAGKHVYTEKPLAMTTDQAIQLRDAARQAGVRLAAAPCNVLGEAAQTMWASLRSGAIGKPLLVYAELDDGMIHRANYAQWISRSGRPWPARGEFATGCTFEHAGYVIAILTALFGPVQSVTSYAALLVADKDIAPPLPHAAPDFSTGVLAFSNGVAARITNSIVAPYDHRLRVVGETGTLELQEPWDYACPVTIRRPASTRIARYLERRFNGIGNARRIKPVRPTPFRGGRGHPTMDFMRGVAELAGAVAQERRCRLDEDLAVHVTEVTEMLQHPERFDRPARVRSTVQQMEPMEWAR
ncbi:MAG: Gfo/Idh/MocA family oxidoreductase [Hyphomicrobiales bacterium]|nr:Gfo/Idh/MocA family oxidoreductase [Hyphomicrobiales bacterium]